MNVPYAEVIGDPVGHSKSPLIHKFWLLKLGIAAVYRATRVAPRELAAFLKQRRADLYWRGCNVTAPHKREAARLVGDPIGACAWLGAVVVPINTASMGPQIALATTVPYIVAQTAISLNVNFLNKLLRRCLWQRIFGFRFIFRFFVWFGKAGQDGESQNRKNN